ncbi:MAG TPA: NAD(P)H-hydrate dehydratase, partial [Woeseiaceae bacterium]|nr:NAD(P)H-hydrate dehydratase [Woeseiaceae bacterium]
WAEALLESVLASSRRLVLDADALNLLARRPAARARCVLTPHPGEAARLLEVSAAAVQGDRIAAVHALQRRYGGTVVLKGSGTLVSAAHGAPWLCVRGNPGMATAGMGDVLSGIVAGLMAQGLDGEMAALAAVDVHAAAADVAAAGGERGLLASDLFEELRPWLNP